MHIKEIFIAIIDIKQFANQEYNLVNHQKGYKGGWHFASRYRYSGEYSTHGPIVINVDPGYCFWQKVIRNDKLVKILILLIVEDIIRKELLKAC